MMFRTSHRMCETHNSFYSGRCETNPGKSSFHLRRTRTPAAHLIQKLLCLRRSVPHGLQYQNLNFMPHSRLIAKVFVQDQLHGNDSNTYFSHQRTRGSFSASLPRIYGMNSALWTQSRRMAPHFLLGATSWSFLILFILRLTSFPAFTGN